MNFVVILINLHKLFGTQVKSINQSRGLDEKFGRFRNLDDLMTYNLYISPGTLNVKYDTVNISLMNHR